MGLRIDPSGGGQLNQALRKVLEVEQQPIKNFEGRKSIEEARIKLFQEFKGKFSGLDKALNDISSAKKLREFKVDLGEGKDLVGITIDKELAQPGTYELEIMQTAARSSMISNPVANPKEANLGTGFITFTDSEGNDVELFIDESNSSLEGIARAINDSRDCPVRAAVIKDSSDSDRPYRMVISAKKEGDGNNLKFPDFYFLGGEEDFYVDDDHEAQNAKLTVDGFEIEASSNMVENFLPGVNLQIKGAKEGQRFTVTISEDTPKVAVKIKAVVDQVNQVLEFINKQNKVDEKSDTRSTFTGDTSLTNIEYRLRNQFHEAFGSRPDPDDPSFRLYHLHELGIEFEKSGALKFNEEKFNKAIESDFEGVAEALTGDFGFVFQMRSVLEGYTKTGNGLLALRERSLRERVTNIDRQIERAQANYDRKAQMLTDRFAKMQSALQSMQQQQAYVSAALGGGGGGNIVEQLIGGR